MLSLADTEDKDFGNHWQEAEILPSFEIRGLEL